MKMSEALNTCMMEQSLKRKIILIYSTETLPVYTAVDGSLSNQMKMVFFRKQYYSLFPYMARLVQTLMTLRIYCQNKKLKFVQYFRMTTQCYK